MVEIVWEIVVKKADCGQFELAYGPGGAWSNLFARQPGFRGINVLRDTNNQQRYLVFEFWESAVMRQQSLDDCRQKYCELETALRAWTEQLSEVGTFRMLAEAGIRPIAKAGRVRGRGTG